MWLAPGTPSDGYKYVEIHESVAERVVERVTKNITVGRYRSRS